MKTLTTMCTGELVAWKGSRRGQPWSADALVTLITAMNGVEFRMDTTVQDIMDGSVDGTGDLPHEIAAYQNVYETRGNPPDAVRAAWTEAIAGLAAWFRAVGVSHHALKDEAIRLARARRAA